MKKILTFVLSIIIIFLLINGILNSTKVYTSKIQIPGLLEPKARDKMEQTDIMLLDSKFEEEKLIVTKEDLEVEPHIDSITKKKYITYEDFDAIGNGINDDYTAIRKTHEVANKNNYEVRAKEGKTYHIFRKNNTDVIQITTNTNWNHCNFIIHDEDIAEDITRTTSLFNIVDKEKNIDITDQNILSTIMLNKNTKRIDKLSGYGNCLCLVYNENKMQYIRSGLNKNNGNIQCDFFKIDNEGNILNDIQWDFDHISLIRLIPIPEETLLVQNGNFQTNLLEEEYEQETSYFNRNIVCYRSNTILRNINHKANNNEYIGGPYLGFIKIEYATDVTLEDSSLFTHKYKEKSSYDLFMEYGVNINLKNLTSNDIDKDNRWGITGTNYLKDITYENCTLNRIDTHAGVHNLTIKDCTIGVKGITVVGSGDLNVVHTTNLGRGSFINLRSDYGSTWNGTINIKDCIYQSEANKIIDFNISYDGEKVHDYGYDLYLPNINIDNLKVENENDMYIFVNDKNATGVENGEIRDAYHLPRNIRIKNYESTSGKELKLFSNQFYNELKELGINFSMTASDKQESEIITEDNTTIDKSNTSTRKGNYIDRTIATTRLPAAGIKQIIIMTITIVLVVGAISFIRYKTIKLK